MVPVKPSRLSAHPLWQRSEPTFRPSDPQKTVFRDFPSIFFLTLSPFLLSTLLFYSALLCFSSLHIVGSLTSKLPLFRIQRIHLPKDLPNKSSAIDVGIINPKNHLPPSKEVWMRKTARIYLDLQTTALAW